jgi:hypothetical protein
MGELFSWTNERRKVAGILIARPLSTADDLFAASFSGLIWCQNRTQQIVIASS